MAYLSSGSIYIYPCMDDIMTKPAIVQRERAVEGAGQNASGPVGVGLGAARLARELSGCLLSVLLASLRLCTQVNSRK